jgi:hypothetical protein
MISYQIMVNGRKAFTAGAEPEDALEVRIDKLPGHESIVLSVTAFSPNKYADEASSNWGMHQLEVGDEISLKVAEADVIDEPQSVEPIANNQELLYCGFCKKSQHEVNHLVSGNDFSICNECIVMCSEIITE